MVTPGGTARPPAPPLQDALPCGVPGSLGMPVASPPRRLHLVLQHQGRAGGSLVASLLAQYHEARGVPAVGFDLAPLAPGFARYGRADRRPGALDVRRVARRDEFRRWSFDRSMDDLAEAVYRAAAPAGATALAAVADVSPAGFLAFFDGCADGAVGPGFSAVGVGLVLHAVAPAGEAVPPEAAAYYARDIALPADTTAVVWLNDGPDGAAGGALYGTAGRAVRTAGAIVAALGARYRLGGVVHVPTLPGLAPGLAAHSAPHAPLEADVPPHAPAPDAGARTIAEALRAARPDSAARRRLRAARDDVFAQIARALGETGDPHPLAEARTSPSVTHA